MCMKSFPDKGNSQAKGSQVDFPFTHSGTSSLWAVSKARMNQRQGGQSRPTWVREAPGCPFRPLRWWRERLGSPRGLDSFSFHPHFPLSEPIYTSSPDLPHLLYSKTSFPAGHLDVHQASILSRHIPNGPQHLSPRAFLSLPIFESPPYYPRQKPACLFSLSHGLYLTGCIVLLILPA